MNREEERSVLDAFEVNSVYPRRDVEGASKGAFVSEQGSVDEIRGMSIVCKP